MTDESVALTTLKKIFSEKTTPILLWIGAGMSIPAGMPSWEKLRNDLLNLMRKKVRDISEGRDRLKSKLRAAEALKDEPWRSFQLIKEGLGATEYEVAIRQLISPSTVLELPESYKLLTELRPRAVLNLNIDRLATRAMQDDGMPTEILGKDVSNYFGLFRSTKRFIVNLHGDVENVSSWIFTESELRMLTDSEPYKQFISSCLSQFCCVFIGISPFDVAVGSHLERVALQAPSTGPHFWLTNSDSYALDQWAQKSRVLTVRYKAKGEDHSELYRLIRSILDFRSSDAIENPIVPTMLSPSDLNGLAQIEAPHDLDKLSAEEIRVALNRKVKEILSPGDQSSYQAFHDFSISYESPIYRAWHVTDRPPNNVLLGFTIEKQAGGGAFGTVYKAFNSDGKQVALKVLHQSARTKSDMLQSFRRGVRAMEILTDAGIAGVTNFHGASEVPAFVVMDWIEGPTLSDVISANQLGDSIELRIDVALQLAKIIKSAHALPSRVLHRDIRPTNVMLSEYWDTGVPNVVVLDFDLSWHKDAQELSIIQGSSSSGYLAPEQLDESRKAPTRSALVDSFGVGMTVFFLFAGRDPLPGESFHADWPNTIEKLSKEWSPSSWRSSGARIGRLIKRCTLEVQARRWDLSQVVIELTSIIDALRNPHDVCSGDGLAEELMARTFGLEYSLGDDERSFVRTSQSGMSAFLGASGGGKIIDLKLRWTDSGFVNHQRRKKWISASVEASEQMLSASGWSISENRVSTQDLEISASIAVEGMSERLNSLASTLLRVSEKLQMS